MADDDGAIRLAELEAHNRRLRRLLDQRDAPGELRHRLNSTLAMLRIVIRKSAETKRDVEAYVGHLEDRLDAVARAQAAADARGSVDLHGLLADELLHYGATEGERFLLSGPVVHLQPRAGQVLALAVHELAVNAVEHGALGPDAGRIEVAWNVAGEEADTPLTITWKELGLTGVVEGAHQGFGTEVLTRTLAYELKAATALAFEEDGLRCTIRFPLTERVGRLGEA
jgi:two-component sensor histidine kinase